MLKYLRFAVTSLSLTACVTLTSLWVRSYWWSDEVGILPVGRWGATAGSERGTTYFTANEGIAIYPYVFSEYIGDFRFDGEWEIYGYGPLGFDLSIKEDAFSHDLLVEIPHWFWVFLSASIAVAP